MKKTIPWGITWFMALMLVFSLNSWGQGSEDFTNSNLTATYADGSFVGNNGIEWTYVHTRNEGDFPIDGNGIMLRRSDEPSSLSATFTGGIGNFSVDTRKAFTGNSQRRLELVINGEVIQQFEPAYGDGADATIFPFIVEDINVEGSIDLILRLYGATGNQQMTLDNIVWTGYEAQDPFVENFQAIPAYFNVTGHTERGFAVDDNNIYVASRNAGIFVKVHDRLTGALTGDLVTTGITGGTFAINDVEVTADGVILAANMAMGDAGVFKIYQMDAVDAPVVVLEHPVTGGRFGDKFTVVGSMTDGSAVIYAANGLAPTVLKWTMEPDDLGTGFVFGDPETISIAVTQGSTPVVAPKPDGSFYYTASGHGVSKLNADGTLIGAISTDLVASSSTAMKYLGTDGTDEFLAIYQNGPGNENIRVVRLINGDPTDAIIEFITPSMFVNPNPNGTGDVAFIPNLAKETGNVDLYVLGTSNGVGSYTSQTLNITFPVYEPILDLDPITFYFRGPDWMDNNPHNPEVWGPFASDDWTSETFQWNEELQWWTAEVHVTDAEAEITYQVRFAEAGTTKFQKAPDGSDPTFTTTTGQIFVDASGELIWDVGGSDDFALADEYITEDMPVDPVFARAQIIHNSADPAAALVDIFVNGEEFLPNFAFRTATPFVDVPAEVELTIAIAPAGQGIGAAVGTFTVTLTEDETYVIVANGLIPANGDKDDIGTDFSLFPYAGAREEAVTATNTDVLVFHGSTDAPTVSVWVMGGDAELFAFSYGEFQPYLELLTDDYVLEIRTEDGATVVASYIAPLDLLDLDGAAITVLASGFLTAADDKDNAAFGLFAATAAGGALVELPVYDPPVFTVTFVIEDEEGDAVADAVVTLNGEANAEGNYVFENLLAGEYAYSIEAAGYEIAEGTVTVVDEDVTVTVTLLVDDIVALTEFFENFDDVTAPALPEGWSKIVEAANTTADIQTSTLSFQVSEPNHIRMLNGNDANPTMLLIGPKITHFETNWLTFWGRNSSAVQTADLAIGYMTNPNNAASFVAVDTVSLDGNVYDKFFVNFEGLLDTDEYFLAFKYLPMVNFRTIYMDDVTWGIAPTQPVLTADHEALDFDLVDVDGELSLSLTIQNQGVGTLTITDGDMVFGGADAALFSLPADLVYPIELELAETFTFDVTFSPVSEGAKTATLTITHNGENSPFDVALTGEGLGTLSAFFEDFNEVETPALPGGWTAIVESTNANANVETTHLANPYSLPYHVRMQNSGDLNALLMLVSPKVDSFESNWLTFWAKFSTAAQNDNIVIGYTPDRNDATAFVALDTIFVSGNVYTRFTYEFPETLLDTDEYHIVFKADYSSTFRTFTIDDIVFEEKPTAGVLAISPEEFAWEDIFINETTPNQTFTLSNFGVADLVFEEGSITLTGTDADLFGLIISEDLEFPLTLEPEESFTIEANFSPVEEGAFSANISLVASGETHLVPLTGTSIDPTLTPDFMFDFLGDFPPENWTRWVGELMDTTELAPVASVWVHGRFGGQADQPLNSGRLNIFGSTRNHWLVTPPIDLGDGTTDYMLNFDMALTAWNSSNPGNFGPNQYAAVVISTNNGQTWESANILQMWGSGDNIPNTGEAVTFDLSEYSGIVKIGFYGESRAGGGDVDWFVTNVGVREIEYFTATFNVKDSQNNDILDATVTLDGETLTAAPYLFEDLLFGSYDYSVSKPGYIAVTGSIEIEDADVVVDVVLLDAFTVDFTVTSGANPVVMANIDIYDDADNQVGALVTDADGEASILLSDGSYTYDVFAVGFDLLENQSFTLVDADLSISVVLTGPEPMMLPFVEDFNDTILPEDWIIVNQPNHQPEDTWQIIASLDGNSIDGTPFAIIDSDDAGSPAGTINSMLYTPAIDASDVTGVLTLSFEQYYRHLGANAFGKVEVWNGTEWIELATYTANVGSWAAPALTTFDITEHANAQLRVRFHYTDGGSWAWYWAIDNVAIRDLQEYTLTLNVNPEDWGTVTGAGTHLETSQVEVTATPNAGFAFLNWTDEDGEVVSTEANNVITMPSEDLTLTANFAPGAADPITLNALLDMTYENLPVEIGSGGNARSAALYQNRYVVVASRENGPNVWVWDSKNPHLDPVALNMGTDIIEPVTFPINYVRTVGNNIYVSNLSLNPSGDGWGQGIFKIYRWTSLESAPEAVISYDALPGRLGDAFSIIGDPAADGHIIAHINTSKEFRVWNFEGGVLQNEDNPDLITLDVEFDHINNHGIINPIEGEDDIFVLTSNNIGIMIVDIDGDILAHMDTDVIDMRSYDPNIFYHNGNRYLSYTLNNETNADIAARHQIVDISLGETVIEAINFISTSEVLANRLVYDKQMGDAGHANLTATNQVAFDEDGELMILAHVVGKGFVLETTGALPPTYTLTVEAEPAEGGAVTGGGEYYEGSTVPVSATAAIGYEFVNWTIGTDEVSTDAEFNYTMPAEATTLVANFNEIPITEVATLAELRDLPADGTFYRYTGEAVIVAMDGFRNRKFLQDATAAILIDDQPGIITPEYELYDVITDVVGVLNVFNQMLRFQPRFDAEPATENTPVDPYDFTIDGLTSDDQAKLVKLYNVTFTDIADGQVFANGQNYTITDGENTLAVRTDFWNVDYIGEEIPVTPLNITGVILQFHDNLQLVPRFEADFEEYIAPETFAVTFNVNMSTAEGFDPDNDVVYMTGDLLGWAEPGDDPANQTMERVGDSWIYTNTLELEAGTYEYKYFLNAGWDGGEWDGGANRTVTVADDMTVNDVWGTTEPVFALTLVADPADGGTVNGAGLYEEGEEVLLTAVAADDFVFVNWTDADDVVVSTEAEFTFTMPAMDVVLTANFDEDVSVGDITSLDINVFPNPARDNFNITANSIIRSIVITDITGKVVYNDVINDNETRINNSFESGIYLLRIHTDEGVFVRKLQIQK